MICKEMAARGVEALFPIQAATFDLLFNGKKDCIGRARTGMGKTLAFALPLIERVLTTRYAPDATEPPRVSPLRDRAC